MAGRNANRKERFAEEMAVLSSAAGSPAGDGPAAQGAGRFGEHDPRRRQHLLGAQPTDRRVGRCPRRGRDPGGLARRQARSTPCLGFGAGASIASSTATSSTGWCASPGRSRSTATATRCSRPAGSGWPTTLLKDRRPGRAVKEYLAVLHLAAPGGREPAWTRRCGCLLDAGQPPDADAVTEAPASGPAAVGGDRGLDRGCGSDDVRPAPGAEGGP